MVENNWRVLYKAAILETDPVRLELRVKAVEDAIRARQALDGQVSSGERAEMKEALDSLGVLEIEWKHRTKRTARQRFAVTANSRRRQGRMAR